MALGGRRTEDEDMDRKPERPAARGIDATSAWNVAREAYDLLTAQIGYVELLAADGGDPGRVTTDRLEIEQARRQLVDLVSRARGAGSVGDEEAGALLGDDLEAGRSVARAILARERPPWERG